MLAAAKEHFEVVELLKGAGAAEHRVKKPVSINIYNNV